MPLAQRAFLVLTVGLLVLLLVGLLRARLHRLSYAFTGYIVAVLCGDAAWLIAPGRFYTWGFWAAKETTYSALKLAVAVELATLSFQAFPRARARTLLALLTVLGVLLVAVVAGSSSRALQDLAIELQGHMANATVFLLALVWGSVLWYRVPLHPFHRAIMWGLGPYLLTFTVLMRLLTGFGWHQHRVVSYIDAMAYTGILAFWAWRAWTPLPQPEDPELLSQLQPWRGRL